MWKWWRRIKRKNFTTDLWQIWHVYSTYVHAHIGDLHAVARRLTDSRLADAVVVSDGWATWRRSDGEIAEGSLGIEVSERGTRATLDLEIAKDTTPWTFECLYTAAHMLYAEVQAFGEPSPVPSLRAVLTECRLEATEFGANVYPVVRLYETGVLIVELRMFSTTDAEYDVETLIHHFENAPMDEFTRAVVPAAIAALAPFLSSEWTTNNVFSRASLLRAERLHRAAVLERMEKKTSGDFQFDVCELPRHEGQTETFADLALLIANAVAYVASNPRKGLPLLLLGQRQLLSTERWSGRPHVHLLRFSNQRSSARENETLHKGAVGAILARVPDVQAGERFMEKNLRQFDDYGVYMNRAVRVWMYTPAAVAAPDGTIADEGYGHVVFGQQVVAELLEYVYAAHDRLLDAVRNYAADAQFVAQLRMMTAELRAGFDSHVHAGELRELLRDGIARSGVPEMTEQISEILNAKGDLFRYEEDRRQSRWGTLVTVVFGLVAVPPLATDVLSPLWKALDLWLPRNGDWAELYLIGIAVGATTALLAAIRWTLLRD